MATGKPCDIKVNGQDLISQTSSAIFRVRHRDSPEALGTAVYVGEPGWFLGAKHSFQGFAPNGRYVERKIGNSTYEVDIEVFDSATHDLFIARARTPANLPIQPADIKTLNASYEGILVGFDKTDRYTSGLARRKFSYSSADVIDDSKQTVGVFVEPGGLFPGLSGAPFFDGSARVVALASERETALSVKINGQITAETLKKMNAAKAVPISAVLEVMRSIDRESSTGEVVRAIEQFERLGSNVFANNISRSTFQDTLLFARMTDPSFVNRLDSKNRARILQMAVLFDQGCYEVMSRKFVDAIVSVEIREAGELLKQTAFLDNRTFSDFAEAVTVGPNNVVRASPLARELQVIAADRLKVPVQYADSQALYATMLSAKKSEYVFLKDESASQIVVTGSVAGVKPNLGSDDIGPTVQTLDAQIKVMQQQLEGRKDLSPRVQAAVSRDRSGAF